MRIWHVAVLATVGGILLHACIVLLAFSDEGSETAAEATPRIVVTAAVQPSATPQPTALPDRATCEEIRGTEYRSDGERDFFRTNCITPVP